MTFDRKRIERLLGSRGMFMTWLQEQPEGRIFNAVDPERCMIASYLGDHGQAVSCDYLGVLPRKGPVGDETRIPKWGLTVQDVAMERPDDEISAGELVRLGREGAW